MLTRKDALIRVQELANQLGRSIPRKTLTGLTEKQLQDAILKLRDEIQFRRRAWQSVGAQGTSRLVARI